MSQKSQSLISNVKTEACRNIAVTIKEDYGVKVVGTDMKVRGHGVL